MNDDSFEKLNAEVRRLTFEVIEDAQRTSIIVSPGMSIDEVFKRNCTKFMGKKFDGFAYGREFLIAYILELNGYEVSIEEISKRLEAARKHKRI